MEENVIEEDFIEDLDQNIEAPRFEKHSFNESLKVPLTEEELRDIAEELARVLKLKSEKEGEKKEVTSQFKADIERFENESHSKARLIRNKYEYRSVECEEVFDFLHNKVTVARLDTGEIVRERAMTNNEMQQNLPLENEYSQCDNPSE